MDLDDLKIEINKLSGKSNVPSKTELFFAITEGDVTPIVFIRENWFKHYISDIGEELDLRFYIDDLDKLPKKIGVYSADLLMTSKKCNHHEDPDEWDMYCWLENIKLKMEYD